MPASGMPELAVDPSSVAHLRLHDWPELPSRLGRRFERVWAWAIDRMPGWELLAEEVQVREQKRTVGSLDLLARRHGEVLHLELAVKFYLCLRGQTGAQDHHWVGPNKRDRLDLKLARMRTHQLPMGQRPQTLATLAERGLPPPDHSRAVLRGLRFSDWRAPHTGGAGRWCTIDELSDAVTAAHVLQRTQWLGGHAPPELLRGAQLHQVVQARLQRGAVQLIDDHHARVMVVSSAWADASPPSPTAL